MNIKLFAAAIIAGASLFVSACIGNKVDPTIAELPDKVASLEQQLAALRTTLTTAYETISSHQSDAQGLRDEITALLALKLDKSSYEAFQASASEAQKLLSGLKYADKDWVSQIISLLKDIYDMDPGQWSQAYVQLQELISGEISRLELRLENAEKAIDALTKKGGIIENIQKAIEDLESGKVDKADFDAFKTQTAKNLSDIQQAAEAILALSAAVPGNMTFVQYVDQVIAQLGDYVLASTFNAFCATAATKSELYGLQSMLQARIKACEDLLAGDWGGKTVQKFVRSEIQALQPVLKNLTEVTIPQLQQDIDDLKSLKLDKADFEAYKAATAVTLASIVNSIKALEKLVAGVPDGKSILDCVYASLAAVQAELEGRIRVCEDLLSGDWGGLTVQEYIDAMCSRVQSIVLVPAYDDNKISLKSVGSTVNSFKIMPADAAMTVVSLFSSNPGAFSFEVKTVATRAPIQEEVYFEITPESLQIDRENMQKGYVILKMRCNYDILTSADKSKAYSAALVINVPKTRTNLGLSISSPFYGVYIEK